MIWSTKHDVVRDWVCDIYRIIEKLSFYRYLTICLSLYISKNNKWLNALLFSKSKYLFSFLSVYLSFYMFIYISFLVTMAVWSLYQDECLESKRIHFYIFLCMYIYLVFYRSIYPSIYLSIYITKNCWTLFNCWNFCKYIFISLYVYLYIIQYTYPSCLYLYSIYISIHLTNNECLNPYKCLEI